MTKAGPSPAKKSRPGVCAFIAATIIAGDDDTESILRKVRRKFKESRAKAADVSIIRRKIALGRYDHLKPAPKARHRTGGVRKPSSKK